MKPPENQYTYKKQIGFTETQRKSLEKLENYGVNVSQFIRQAVKEKINCDWKMIKEKNLNDTHSQQLNIAGVSGSFQDIKEVIEFLQWVFKKIDKGDTPQETVRMLLMNRSKIDSINFDSNDR